MKAQNKVVDLNIAQACMHDHSHSLTGPYYYYRSANPKPSGHRAYTQRVCSHTMDPIMITIIISIVPINMTHQMAECDLTVLNM